MQNNEKKPIKNMQVLQELQKQAETGTLQYVEIDSESIRTYLDYLSYRVQSELFSICREDVEDLTWEEFASILSRSKALFYPAKKVMEMALDAFSVNPSDFSHALGIADPNEDPGKIWTVVRLYSKEEAPEILKRCIFETELAHFQYLLAKNENYSWQQYLYDLKTKSVVLRSMLNAFQRGLFALDTKEYWSSPEVTEIAHKFEDA